VLDTASGEPDLDPASSVTIDARCGMTRHGRRAAASVGPGKTGEHGAMVVFADRYTKKETDADGNDVEREIPFLKAYTVFNVAQIEGLPAHYYAEPEAKGEKLHLIESAEKFFAATRAVIRHGANMAYYASAADVIQLPVPEAFRDAESYAATKARTRSAL
jgi:antirestriction protein ArdC